MTHLKKYWYWYLIAIALIAAGIWSYYNWETVKGWFSSSAPAPASESDSQHRIGNFPAVPEGIFTTNESLRQSAPMPISGYKLCASHSLLFPKDVDPIKVQNFINQLQAEFNMIAAQGIKILLKVSIAPNTITPGSIITFSVYSDDCNQELVKKASAYINSIH